MSDDSPRHGPQVHPHLVEQAMQEDVADHFTELWGCSQVLGLETGTPRDTYADEKPIEDLLDFASIDYVVDMPNGDVFGVSHREKSPTRYPLDFSVQRSNAAGYTTEYHTFRDGPEKLVLCPRYATRIKRTDDGDVDWLRVVSVKSFSEAIRAGLSHDGEWSDEHGRVAWFYEYETLAEIGCIEHDSTGEYA